MKRLPLQKNGETKKQSANNDDFEIDFSSANKYESKNGMSYTFMIKNKEENPKQFENLVVEKHHDGTISGFVVRYEYSQRYQDSLKKGIVIPFEGSVQRTENKEKLEELKDFFKNEKTAKKTTTAKSAGEVCVETTYVTQSMCPSGTHSPGQDCDIVKGIWFGYHMETVITCVRDGNTSTHWGWLASSDSYTSTVPNSGGTTTVTLEPGLFDSAESIQTFVNRYGLTGKEIEWARYRPNRNKVEWFMENNDYSPYAKTVVTAAIKYFATNINTSIEQFENWFMGSSEGQDGDYDATYWEDPNLTFPQQNLPTWADFYNAYPKNSNGTFEMNYADVYNLVGGTPKALRDAVLNDNNPLNDHDYDNACALRTSRAMNYSGITIPNLPGKTFKGADNKYYFLGARNLYNWMIKSFPPNNTNNIILNQSDGGKDGFNFPSLLGLNHGIYILLPVNQSSSGFGASGHAGIYTHPELTHYYFAAKGGVKSITLWKLN